MDLGTDMNAIPRYILMMLAAVRYQGDARAFFALSVKCLVEKFESVNEGHLSLSCELTISFSSYFLFLFLLRY